MRQFNELATKDPAAAAALYRDSIVGNADAAYRQSVVDGSKPGLQQLGTTVVDGNTVKSTRDSVLGSLSEASKALHASGQGDLAKSMTKSLADGIEAKDKANTAAGNGGIYAGTAERNNLGKSLADTIGAGKGADLTADLTIEMHERAKADPKANGSFPGTRSEQLAGAVGRGMTAGLNQTATAFGEKVGDIKATAQRYAAAMEGYGKYVDKQKAAEVAQRDIGAKVEAANASAAAHVDAMNAAARVIDANAFNGQIEKNDLKGSFEKGAALLPDAGETPAGRAALAGTFEKSLAGERTMFETLGDKGFSTEAKAAGFEAAAKGGLTSAALRAEANQPVKEVADHLAKKADSLLEGKTAEAAKIALGQAMANGGDPAAYAAAVEKMAAAGELTPGMQKAIGGLGVLSDGVSLGKKVETLLRNDPNFLKNNPNYARALGAASLAGSTAKAIKGLSDGNVSVKDMLATATAITDAGKLLYPESALLKGAGKYLGAAGVGLGMIDSVRNGDIIGLASGSAAMYGILTGNPAIAAVAGLFDVGRAGYNAFSEGRVQNQFDKQFLRDVGYSDRAATGLSIQMGIGADRQLDMAIQRDMAANPDLSVQQAVERFMVRYGG